MTKILREDVHKLAQLSSLQLADDEINALQHDIENILSYVEQLQELATEGVDPTYQVTNLSNVSRNDEVIDYNVSSDQLLALAPASRNGQVEVPKVL